MKDAPGDTRQPYRVIRVLIHPGKHSLAVSVVARTVQGRLQRDHLVWRGDGGPLPHVATAADILRAAADSIAKAADGV